MINLRSGEIVLVFKPYPGMRPMHSFCRACLEHDIQIDSGNYRLEVMRQDVDTKKFSWCKVYKVYMEA
jgi:hypothetical protein